MNYYTEFVPALEQELATRTDEELQEGYEYWVMEDFPGNDDQWKAQSRMRSYERVAAARGLTLIERAPQF